MYRRNLNISSIKIKEQAYKAFVRPILGYASTVWDPHLKKDIAKLEQVQRRAARFVKQNYHNRSRVTKLLEELNWMPLVDRRKNARLVMFYKIKNQKVAINFDSNVKPATRSSRNADTNSTYQTEHCRTNTRKCSFFPRTVIGIDWNLLPPKKQRQLSSASSGPS